MLFTEALEQLKARVFVHRKAWTPEDGYLALLPGASHIWKIVTHPGMNAGNYIFSVEDFSSDDWQVFQLAKPVVEEAVVEEVAAEA